jgi:hypothetical protein
MRYSVPVAYFLWLVSGCGALGFHRFYLGKTGSGLVWMFTGGLGMVGAAYDFFTMRRQVTEANLRYDMRAALDYDNSGYARRRVDLPGRPESLEKVILRTARKNGGAVTPGEVALEGDFSVEDARKALEKLAASGNAEMRVRSSGVVVYVFPEFARDGKDDYIA